ATEMRTDLQRLKRDRKAGLAAVIEAENLTESVAIQTRSDSSSRGKQKTFYPTEGQAVAERPPSRHWRVRVSTAALAIVSLFGCGLYFRSHQAKLLTEKDTVA